MVYRVDIYLIMETGGAGAIHLTGHDTRGTSTHASCSHNSEQVNDIRFLMIGQIWYTKVFEQQCTDKQVPLQSTSVSSLDPGRLLPCLQPSRLLSFDTSPIRCETASCV